MMLKVVPACALVFCGLTLSALAHGKATGIVRERMDLMVVLKDATKALSDMMRGDAAYDAVAAAAAAKDIAGHGGQAMTRLFPEGSTMASEALPAVWTDWSRFQTLAAQLEKYADALAMNAARGPAGGAPAPAAGGMMAGPAPAPDAAALADMAPDAIFLLIADTCTACHQDFRKEEKK